jgi:MPBQ/MSBQ methyltransferase
MQNQIRRRAVSAGSNLAARLEVAFENPVDNIRGFDGSFFYGEFSAETVYEANTGGLHPVAQKIDWGLKFYRDVLKLDSLHFGYWEPTDELTLENMRRAQDRYTEHLKDLIPDGVKKILDSGCGTGVVARRLKDSGYDVTSITPDEYQETLFVRRNPDIDFRRTRLEDFRAAAPYDLALFSESFQYLDIDAALDKCLEVLKDGGYIIISDYFRKTREPYYRTCHVESDFLEAVARRPLSILETRDITDKAAPTLSLGARIYSEYALPTLEIITGYAAEKRPLLTRILSAIFYFPLKKIRGYLYERMTDKVDAAKFRRLMSYKVFVLKKI